LLLCLASLAASASPSIAATHEWEGYTQTLAPGQVIEQELACKQGTLVSGGYSLDSTDGPRSKLIVVVDAPVSDNKWRVGLMNDHDAPVHILFRLSILCD
jgi:hypothetical protein